MMRFCFVAVLLSLGVLVTTSCKREETSAVDSGSTPNTYSVTGIVVSLNPADASAIIKHQTIPGYMMAMTMPFAVKDTNELAGLQAGEEVTFQMLVTMDDMWIEDVKKTGVVTNLPPTTGHFRLVREVEPLEVGDELPEYHFINEQGEAVSLSQWRGNALVLSFLFTRCPVPNFCPLTARKLVEMQNKLSAQSANPTNWHILCITVDPEWDTPEQLKQFGEAYGLKLEHANLLTGELIDITAIAEQFGLRFWTEAGTISHNLRTVVVDAGGMIQTNMIGNEWAVEDLMGQVLAATAGQSKKE